MPTEPLTAEEREIREIVNRVSRAKQVLHDDDPALTLRAAVKLVDSLEAARRELAGARMEVSVLMAVEPPVDEVRRELAGRWIAVTERLPEPVAFDCSDNVIVWCAVHALAYYDHGIKQWRDAEDRGQPWEPDMTITHWQPLPATPAQQEGQ